MSDHEVWVQLYIGKTKSGDVFDIDHVPKNISALKKAVHQAKDKSLLHCNAPHLLVYSPGTDFPLNEGDKLDPGDAVSEHTTSTSSKNPLRVVAPDLVQYNTTKQSAGDPGYPFNDSIYILYSKPNETEIFVIATAFAVTKTMALTTGRTISSKNNKSGQIMLINEPLFLTTVLERNDGVISPEEGKVEIPVTVKKFHHEYDWAVLERSDGRVFPQTIPVATSVSDIPSYGESMTFYRVPVALFRDDMENTDRVHVVPKQGYVGLVKKNYIDFQNGGFDGSCGGPYVYRGKAIAIHRESMNSALTAEALRIHQIQQQQGDRMEFQSNKRMKVADEMTLADGCAESHTSVVGSGVLICKRLELVQCITAQDST